MANKFGFIFLLTLVALLSCESRELEKPSAPDHHPNSTTGPLSQQPQFKDFMFIQTWPPTHCNTSKCLQIPERFTLNSVWPLNAKYAGPNGLTDTILEAHETALLQYWPDLGSITFEASKWFWHNEYKTHGVYCTTKYSAEEYIVKALTLGESVKTRAWLDAKKIVPDKSKLYNRADIVEAIKSFTSVTPDLQCSINGDFSYLKEIRICLDNNLETFVSCGGNVGKCGTQVYYPPAPPPTPPPAPAGSETSEEILEITEDIVDSFEVV